MKALLFLISFLCFLHINEGKRLNCGYGEIQIECRCFQKSTLARLLEAEIDKINNRIKATRKLKVKKQAVIQQFIRQHGAKIGAMYRCKRQRYEALGQVFRAARQLRVVRALRVRCWHLLAIRWRLKRKCSRIKRYLRVLKRKLKSCKRFQSHFLKTYQRAKLYLQTKACKILAFRLRHVIWFHRHRKAQTQYRIMILKRKSYRFHVISARVQAKAKSVCHTAKVLQGRARKLRALLDRARNKYRAAKKCTYKFRGTYRKIARRRLKMYRWLSRTRRFLRRVYQERYKKVKLLCSKVKPKDKRCNELNLRLYSHRHNKYRKYD